MLAAGTSVEDLRKADLPAEMLSPAMDIQSRLDALSERERTFTALLDSVREVSGTGGIDGILFAIVSRARRLLLSEVAYFLTFDAATGRASMTVSDGILTDEFMALEVDRGVGISGHIAATRKPSWTSDYLSDQTYLHGEGIDRATVKEGLSALVGVPVMTEGNVLGVLLAGDRRAHGYRHQDVDLLQQLAAHAAIVIRNAEAQANDLQARGELEDALAELRSKESATHRLIDFQDRLFGILLNGGSMPAVVELTANELGADLRLIDDRGQVLASSPQMQHGAHQGKETGRSEDIVVSGRRIGCLETAGDPTNASPDLASKVLLRAAATSGLIMGSLRATAAEDHASADRLMKELLRGSGSSPARGLLRDAAPFVSGLRRVIAIGSGAVPMAELLGAVRRYAETQPSLASEHSGHVLLWLGDEQPGTLARDVHLAVGSMVNGPIEVGAAVLPAPADKLRQATDQALSTVRLLTALGRTGEWATAADLEPLPSVLSSLTAEQLAAFVDQAIGPLLSYDAKHNTQLVMTLTAVYDAGMNISQAADRLFLHPNTVHQRLARIDELLGSHWKDGASHLQRRLAITVWTLQRQSQEVLPTGSERNQS
ncbi:helix-turn-helix domain-containing protein [Arthrobacter sp. zg-Y411]|uniref:helix-turn-helix domain-containing protein n=1 Tax=Arthrobacter zhangbolii TaxID=2886936 RepID=UPI001D151195|nr:GAF domain-containing protein [Arthrobacter zhangbolii]MCC3294322.1 helix-turn-helix domain-containing protein [Arthrobacter zhangbolii]